MTPQVYTRNTPYDKTAPRLNSEGGYFRSQRAIMVTVQTIGKAIRRRRRELDITQTDLAKRVKTTVARVSGIERGITHLPLHTLIDIAAALDIEPAELLRGEVR